MCVVLSQTRDSEAASVQKICVCVVTRQNQEFLRARVTQHRLQPIYSFIVTVVPAACIQLRLSSSYIAVGEFLSHRQLETWCEKGTCIERLG